MSELKQVLVSATVEHPLTPVYITSKFKTINEWLINICEGKSPNRPIEEFIVKLSIREDPKEFIICLYGVHTALDNKNQNYTQIVFEPSHMYFKFSKKQYKAFTYQQMQEELTAYLRAFTQTEKFTNSFLSKFTIRTSYDGELIWSKP